MFVATIEGYSRNLSEFYGGASSGFTHTLFQAADALTPNAVSGLAERADNLYDSVNGQPQLVNVLPDGTTEPGAFFGAPPETPEDPPGLEHAISSDGSLIYWTDTNTAVTPEDPAGATRLLVREGGSHTAQVDAAQAPRGEGSKEREERLARSGGGLFWAATSDGSKVFFTDCRPLTESSTAVSSHGCGQRPGLTGNDLYEYEPSTGELVDLTIDHNAGDPLGADVQGVVAESENGSYLYFVANGDLAAGAISGQPNLYLLHEGMTTFIATLSPEDGSLRAYVSFGSIGDWDPTVGHRTAQATPDGQSLVFLSSRSLTGYENRSMEEVYVYDADAGTLSCASCDPSGAPPAGESTMAAELPPGQREDGTYQLRLISEDGSRVFFQSAEPLVPQDTNQRTDVYEWERDGAGSCARSSGCLYLISGGMNASSSYLLDASANGDDVFIVTRAQLAPADQNENYDLYDVRVGAVAPPPAPQCTGTGCQGSPPAAPIFATPASVTFNGAGNLSPTPSQRVVKPKAARPSRHKRGLTQALRRCRHGAARRRSACEKTARRRNHTTTRRSTQRRGK